jgi:ethanolamine utilization protein EutQ (cupin superfamily)
MRSDRSRFDAARSQVKHPIEHAKKQHTMKQIAPDACPVRKFTIQDAQDCMGWSGVSLSDVVNEDEMPGVKLGGVAFSRVPKGATTNFESTYDEVLVITKGKCTVRTENGTITAQASEVSTSRPGRWASFRPMRTLS